MSVLRLGMVALFSLCSRAGPEGHAESLKLLARHPVPRSVPDGSYFHGAVSDTRFTVKLVTLTVVPSPGLAEPGVGWVKNAKVVLPLGLRPSEISRVCG